jgi:hypothetical protein
MPTPVLLETPVRPPRWWAGLGVSVLAHATVVLLAIGVLSGPPGEEPRPASPREVATVLLAPPVSEPPVVHELPEPHPTPPPPPPPPAAPPAPEAPEHDEAAATSPESAPAEPDPVPPASEPAPQPAATPAPVRPPETTTTTSAAATPSLEEEARRLFGGGRRVASPGPVATTGQPVSAVFDGTPCPVDEQAARDSAGRPILERLAGRVFSETGLPLPGAHLQILGTGYSAFSNDHGDFVLSYDRSLLSTCRSQLVRVSAPGFRAQTLMLARGAGTNTVRMPRR